MRANAMSYGRMAKEERRLTGEIEALLAAADVAEDASCRRSRRREDRPVLGGERTDGGQPSGWRAGR